MVETAEKTTSERMDKTWRRMCENNFALVKIYMGMPMVNIREMLKTGMAELPKGYDTPENQPIKDYLQATVDYLSPHKEDGPTFVEI